MRILKEDNRLLLIADDWGDNAYLEHLLGEGGKPYARKTVTPGRFADELTIEITKSLPRSDPPRDYRGKDNHKREDHRDGGAKTRDAGGARGHSPHDDAPAAGPAPAAADGARGG
jgi:hypothetical protein